VIHRDLKPENLVLDDRGYLRLTDLGVSREVKPNNAEDTSGTPGYMAPEVICKTNHSYPVDFFALGVIAYELMTGKVFNLLFSVLILEPIANKSEKKYWLSKFSLIKYLLLDGANKVLILLID
jgi:serine/threonine protein kinase